MKQLFQNLNALRLLAYFFENPYSETHLREIARKAKMSPSTIMRVLHILEREGLVLRREEKHATFFKASMSTEFKMLKVSYTVSKLEGSDIIKIISGRSAGLSALLLYGSAARGEDDARSDYDLLAIAARCRVSGSELSGKLGREISLKKYNISEWKKISRENRAFYLEVISDSIVLLGQKPVID